MTATIDTHALGLTWFESDGLQRAAHALHAGDRVWLVDPFDDEQALEAVAALGHPVSVIQLLDRHSRDCDAVARRLAVPHLRVPSALPDAPFDVISVVNRPWWHEVALWSSDAEALVVAEAVGTSPLFALGRPLGVHPALRFTPPRRALSGLRPQRILVGHGAPLLHDASASLAQALGSARSDVPRLLRQAPSIVRRG